MTPFFLTEETLVFVQLFLQRKHLFCLVLENPPVITSTIGSLSMERIPEHYNEEGDLLLNLINMVTMDGCDF